MARKRNENSLLTSCLTVLRFPSASFTPRSMLLRSFFVSALSAFAISSLIATTPPGVVQAWSIAGPVRVSEIDLETCPTATALTKLQWQSVASDETGTVALFDHFKPLSNGRSKAFARTTLAAEAAESRAFQISFRGEVFAYCNGRRVFHGEPAAVDSPASSSTKATLWLPLVAGANELLLAIRPVQSDWAFSGRDLDAIGQDTRLTQLWSLEHLSARPESVAIDATRKLLYVSDYANDAIAKFDFEGRIIAAAWITGLKRPTGLALIQGRLWAVERGNLVEIDVDAGSVGRRIPIAGASFPNDLAGDGTGTIYVTDSAQGAVYKVADGKTEHWLQDPTIAGSNGICFAGTRLLVGTTGDGSLKSVDLATKAISTFVTLGSGALMDGLVADGTGGFLFSDYYGRILQADAAGKTTLLLDRSGPQQFCADFGYDPASGLLVVPSLFDARLTAYRFRPTEAP